MILEHLLGRAAVVYKLHDGLAVLVFGGVRLVTGRQFEKSIANAGWSTSDLSHRDTSRKTHKEEA